MMFKKIFYFLLIFKTFIANEIIINNKTERTNLYWNYAVKLRNQNDDLAFTRHTGGNGNIYADHHSHKFTQQIKVINNKKIIREILKNIGKSTQSKNVVTLYIEIRNEFSGVYVEPLLRIPLNIFELEKVYVYRDHKKNRLIYSKEEEGDDCCSLCTIM